MWFSSTQFSSAVSEMGEICNKSQKRDTSLVFTMHNEKFNHFWRQRFQVWFIHEQLIWEHLQFPKCQLPVHSFFPYRFSHGICYVAIVFPWINIKFCYWTALTLHLQWRHSIQGTPPFRGHKNRSRKNVHIIFVSVTSFEGTSLFSGKEHILWVPKPRLNLHLEHTSASKSD